MTFSSIMCQSNLTYIQTTNIFRGFERRVRSGGINSKNLMKGSLSSVFRYAQAQLRVHGMLEHPEITAIKTE